MLVGFLLQEAWMVVWNFMAMHYCWDIPVWTTDKLSLPSLETLKKWNEMLATVKIGWSQGQNQMFNGEIPILRLRNEHNCNPTTWNCQCITRQIIHKRLSEMKWQSQERSLISGIISVTNDWFACSFIHLQETTQASWVSLSDSFAACHVNYATVTRCRYTVVT